MSRPVTPASASYGPMPAQSETTSPPSHPTHLASSSRPVSYVGSHPHSGNLDLEHVSGTPRPTSALSQHEQPNDEANFTADRSSAMQRSSSQYSQSQNALPSRGSTLKKKSSIKRTGSLGRTASRKSSYAGSVKSMQLGEKEKYSETEESNSAFSCPIPTSGNPTELLADRFQAWRKVLKDLINYFRDLHKSYDTRSKTLQSASNVLNNSSIPPNFRTSGGIGEAAYILREFQKQALTENNKARDLENEVIMQLTGLRSDLQQKIKEIKSLSGDFKNSVDREQEGTKKGVRSLQDALGVVDQDAAATSGKGDPFLIKLGVDKQLEKQIEEENYLHRAYLNLEASGRELESIVVGEIQKAYTVLAGILNREATQSTDTAEKLKDGPLALAKDYEWDTFVTSNKQMVDPRNPVRQLANIKYPGQDHPAAIEVKSGMLERKSKYLKNYTPGWYILSPTHLHEFKSADRIAFQSPVMSLYLAEQKLGSFSDPGSSSHKFMLKGRQSGSMHRGHSWVFRAETHDTMMAWYNDIKELTEKKGEARNEFVRRIHSRSMSGNSLKAASINSSEADMAEDEADKAPFSGEQSVRGQSVSDGAPIVAGLGPDAGAKDIEDARSEVGWRPPQRPQPGGRFPSEVNVTRGLDAPISPSSGGGDSDRDAIAAAGALPGSGVPFEQTPYQHTDLQNPEPQPTGAFQNQPTGAFQNQPTEAFQSTPPTNSVSGHQPMGPVQSTPPQTNYISGQHPNVVPTASGVVAPTETSSQYGEWMAPIGAGAGGAALGAGFMHHHAAHQQEPEGQLIETVDNSKRQMDAASSVPAYGTSSAPIPVVASEEHERSLSRSRGLTESTQATGTASQFAPSSFGAATINTTTTAPTEYTEYSDRPVLDKVNTSRSVTTISDLPVPGQYPRTPELYEESTPTGPMYGPAY